jgi:acetoin utilization deacetylase AcuC-like enzyme
MTILYTHDACLAHDTAYGHPERSDRLRAVHAALAGNAFSGLDRRDAPRAEIEDLTRLHPRAHVDRILAAIPAEGFARLDADTIVSPGSAEAALRAAGAARAAVDAVVGGEDRTAFCAVRPPGHHAEPTHAMGFCLFNNVAIGAVHALDALGLNRVAIVDFDVHHGNGTQAAFEADGRVFFASTHQSPLYPGTGSARERGVGNILNAPLPPGAGSAQFRHAIREAVLPALDRFRPELLMISAGFDAHAADPLANLNLVEEDFAWVTRELAALARRHCEGRIVATLEGGYDLDALAISCAAHVAELMAA